MTLGRDQIDQDALAAEWGLALEADAANAGHEPTKRTTKRKTTDTALRAALRKAMAVDASTKRVADRGGPVPPDRERRR